MLVATAMAAVLITGDGNGSTEFIHLRLVHTLSGTEGLRVEIRNESGDDMCLPGNYFSAYSVELKSDGEDKHGQGIVGRPAPECVILRAKGRLTYTYNLSELFPGNVLAGKRVCFEFVWKPLSQVKSRNEYQTFDQQEQVCIDLPQTWP